MRKGFTLIELMVSISILSVMVVFLYQSYASLNRSNKFYAAEVKSIKELQLKKRVIFLDYSLAHVKSLKIYKQDRVEDVVFMQTSHSLHKIYNPYVAYVIKENRLYRLESLKAFKEYPFGVDDEFVVDYLGEVDGFRVYKSNTKSKDSTTELYLVHVDFKFGDDILLKIKVLNEE
jgi:prepilin-type N-terminal cleavage/methylation domain-containing protein